MHRPKTLRDIGWRLPNVLIGETGSITASRTQSHTEAVESDEKHEEAIGSVPNRLPMACRPVPTSRPQGLNRKRAGRVASHGDILGLPSRPLSPPSGRLAQIGRAHV